MIGFYNSLLDSEKKLGFEFLDKWHPYPTRINPVFKPYQPVFSDTNPGFYVKTPGFTNPYPTRVQPVSTPYLPVSKIWGSDTWNLMFSNHLFHGSDGANRKFRRQLVSPLPFQSTLETKLDSQIGSVNTLAESDGKTIRNCSHVPMHLCAELYFIFIF